MKTVLAITLFACAAPLAAQPIRDLIDAQAVVRAHEREMQPAIQQMREMTLALEAMAKAQYALTQTQPGIALDQAVKALDEYLDAANRRGVLPRDTAAQLIRARTYLDGFRNGAPIPDLVAIREKFHHNFVHPMQRRTAQMMNQMNSIIGGYDGLLRSMREVSNGAVGAIERVAMDPEKP